MLNARAREYILHGEYRKAAQIIAGESGDLMLMALLSIAGELAALYSVVGAIASDR